MGVFCDRLKLGSTAALDCRTGQNKGRYHEKELLFLLVLLICIIYRAADSHLQIVGDREFYNEIRFHVEVFRFAKSKLIK